MVSVNSFIGWNSTFVRRRYRRRRNDLSCPG